MQASEYLPSFKQQEHHVYFKVMNKYIKYQLTKVKKLTKTFDQRDNRKENDDRNFQTLYQIADIKMQRFHASENLMTQFTFSLLRLP